MAFKFDIISAYKCDDGDGDDDDETNKKKFKLKLKLHPKRETIISTYLSEEKTPETLS